MLSAPGDIRFTETRNSQSLIAEKLRKQNTNGDHFICLRLILAPVSLALRGRQGPQIIKEEALSFGKNSAVSDSLTADSPTFLLHTERSDWFRGLLLYRLAPSKLSESILL